MATITGVMWRSSIVILAPWRAHLCWPEAAYVVSAPRRRVAAGITARTRMLSSSDISVTAVKGGTYGRRNRFPLDQWRMDYLVHHLRPDQPGNWRGTRWLVRRGRSRGSCGNL